MQCLEIKPLDPVFFRNSAPFTMGDETTAQEMFPPNPSVIYGAIRASFFNEGNISLAEIRKKTEKLKIESIYYKKGNKAGFLIPLPADICKIK
ncbi:MAG: hypothetical protein KDK45_20080, partial [Leptospiraceae bacterium]|nr:hypothetical protein [Leptospiraceae bacterium]